MPEAAQAVDGLVAQAGVAIVKTVEGDVVHIAQDIGEAFGSVVGVPISITESIANGIVKAPQKISRNIRGRTEARRQEKNKGQG